MNDRDFMRYSRQILLDDIALDGQQKLLDSQVLIIGLGGLGTPAALYLAGAGVGTLVLADDDDVHLSNLQRQILFTTEDIDRPKSQVSQQRLTQLNPDIQLTAVDAGIGVPSHAAQALEMGADAVLVNTAIAVADDPVNMAKAFRLAVEAGLLARQSGPGSRSYFAHATSPLTGFLEASA